MAVTGGVAQGFLGDAVHMHGCIVRLNAHRTTADELAWHAVRFANLQREILQRRRQSIRTPFHRRQAHCQIARGFDGGVDYAGDALKLRGFGQRFIRQTPAHILREKCQASQFLSQTIVQIVTNSALFLVADFQHFLFETLQFCDVASDMGKTAQRAGVIVNIASIMGQVGGVSAPAYCSTKAAIIMLSRCLAKDGGPLGIRVNSVCPGYIDTPIMDRMLAEQPDPAAMRREILNRQPLGRLGTSEDIAQGVLFLASREAAFISGTELTIDGAVTATQID